MSTRQLIMSLTRAIKISTCLIIGLCLLFSSCTRSSKQGFTFVQVCDPQIRVGEDDSFFQVTGTVERFQTAVKQINALRPNFVVVCGDLVHRSNERSFSAYLEIRNQLIVPCYSAPGNHDYNPVRGDERPTVERLELYRQYFLDDYHTLEHNGYGFVFINTPLYLAKEGGDIWRVDPFEGAIREEYEKQDAWLRSTLLTCKKKKMPVFIIAHHPLHPEMPGLAPGVLSVELRRDLFNLFKETGVVAVLGGHGHQMFIKEYEGIVFVHAHTTSFILEKDPEKRDDFGFRLWHVHTDGTFTHEYIPLDSSWQQVE